ncbi:hypothetical protein CBR_g26073 [Chara braunii]|uniref:Reverse transcriptase n=1 Tax=Chara braunii TaxID=69332 RepID=A0A388JVS0_CHABU|nr:hypothetical protein CBR_g26073 [Chara braunii]|eukprot:GBG61909.1 hypothetical protein CBR_g26073 [Chara braunii]
MGMPSALLAGNGRFWIYASPAYSGYCGCCGPDIMSEQWKAMLDAAADNERPFFQKLYEDAIHREREAEAAARATSIAEQVALLAVPESNDDRFQEKLAAAVAALVQLRTLEDLESRVTTLEQRNQELQAEIVSLKQSQLFAPHPPNPRPAAVPVSHPNIVLMTRASGTVSSAGTGVSSSNGGAGSFALVIVPNAGTSAQNATVLTGVQYSGPVVDKRTTTLPSKYDGKGDITSWISSMRSYFEVLRTPQEDRSMIMGTNTEPVVQSFIELQAITAGYERIDLTEWLKVTPVRTLEDLLITQYQDKRVALKARLKLEALKGQTWRTSMQAVEQHLAGLFTTPNLGWTDESCMDVVLGVAPKEYVSRLGLKDHTTCKRMPNHKVATSTYMRELYALREALTHWKHYLLGRHFKVYSDHQTLHWIKTQTDLSPTLTRWVHDIDVYNFELKHKKGCYNRVADALPRHPELLTCLVDSYDLLRKLKEVLVKHTAKDPDLSPILEQLQADPSSQPDSHECEYLVFRRYGKFDRLCVPNHAPLRNHFLDLAHGRSGHFGFEKAYGSLLQQFNWLGMTGSAHKFIVKCQVWQRTKVHRHKLYDLLKPLPIPDGSGESVSIDFTDMGKVSEGGHSQVMVIVDFLNLIPLPSHAPTELVIEEFHQKYILQYGPPKTLVSDRDTRFISADWTKFTSQIYDIKLNKTSGRHPEANGLAEEINQTVIQLLRALIVPDQNMWDKELHKVKGLYNNSIHSATGVTPNQLQYGWQLRNPLSYLFPERFPGLTPDMLGYNAKYARLLKAAIAAMNKRQHAMIKHANKSRKEANFKVGSYVWVKMSEFSDEEGVSRKLFPLYYGPWQVLKVIGDELGPSYVIDVPLRLRTCPVFHASKLFPHIDDETFPFRDPMIPRPIDDGHEIDRIVSHEGRGRNKQYKVHFLHHPLNEFFWIDQKELLKNAPRVVNAYERQIADGQTAKFSAKLTPHSSRRASSRSAEGEEREDGEGVDKAGEDVGLDRGAEGQAKTKIEKEEEEEVEVPLQRNVRREERGESSGAQEVDAKVERMVNEWVANLALGEEEEALLLVPQAERKAFAKELEGEENPLQQRTIEEEEKLEWKLRLTSERRRKLEAAETMERELQAAEKQRGQLVAQVDLQRKIEIVSQNMEVVLKAQQEQLCYPKGHDIALQSIRKGFQDFAMDMMMRVGTQLHAAMEGTEKFCVGTKGIAEGLAKNKVLRKLRLNWNGLDDRGGEHIGIMLRTNKGIVELSMSNTRAGPNACLVLGEALKHNATLKMLDVSYNPLGEDGGRHLMMGIEDDLTEMTLKYHELTKEVADLRQAQVANPLPLPPRSEAAIETTSAPLTVSSSTSSSGVMATSSGPAAGADSTVAVTSNEAGTSAIAAAPRPEPAAAGPSYASPYVDRKAVQMPSKYDSKNDIERGCKVFSKIDLKSGYHQIEVDSADQHKTAFKTRNGLYEFTVVPFGLTNAPATFQSLMDKVLREQIGRFVVVYLDDILIFSKSMEEHLKHLEEVLAMLKKTQRHLNLEKFEFGKDSVIYLGHRLSAAGLEPEATKIEVIRNWPQPANIRELRSFLGLASYYRKFVARFSIIARPLLRLTSKNVSYSWDVACTEAFRTLKEALVSYPVLRIADPKLTFVVTTDASRYGIGAVLQHDDGDGLRPLEYYSKRMPSVKVATSTYMRELYALRMALDHWKHSLLGRHFKVFSDHETLKWIKQQTTLSPTLLRWFHEVDIFDFELRHKKGCYNRGADALSRHLEYMTCLVKSYDLRKKLKEDLVEQTAKDPELSSILEQLRADPSNDDADFEEVAEDVVHGRLDGGGGIGESEWHHGELVVPEPRAEGGLVGVLLADTDLVEATAKVDLGKVLGSTETIKELENPRRAWAGGGGGGVDRGEACEREVSKGHVGFVGEGGCKVFVAYSFDAGDERKVRNDGGGEVVAEGPDVLDETVPGTGQAEVAELFKVVINGFLGAEGGCEKVGPLEEGVTWSSGGSAVADFSHPPFGGIVEEAGGGNGEPVGKGHVVEVKRVLELVTEVWKVLSAWRMAERSGVAVFAGGCSPARLSAMLSIESVRISDMLMEDEAMSGEEGVEDAAGTDVEDAAAAVAAAAAAALGVLGLVWRHVEGGGQSLIYQ